MSAEYTRSVITFLDILKFKEVRKSSSAQDIHKLLDVFEESSNELGGSPKAELDGFSSLCLSDSVVRTWPVIPGKECECLEAEAICLAKIQWNMILRGVLVRGAVTIGDVYHYKMRIFGAGYERAYYLQEKIAIYPRIIIDPQLLRRKDDKEPVLELENDPGDGIRFVDYLGKSINAIADHQKFLRAQKTDSEDESVRQKMSWFREYHNRRVETLTQVNRLELRV